MIRTIQIGQVGLTAGSLLFPLAIVAASSCAATAGPGRRART
jgi:hypothetical protein